LREYETTFIVQPEISDEGSLAILSKLDGVLEAGGATRLMCEDHGKRKLAYEVRKFHKGHVYTLMFLDEGAIVPDLERTLRLEESVLRFLTIQAELEVADVEARKTSAAEAELEQTKRSEERAVREAEEAVARRESEEAEREASLRAAEEAKAAEAVAQEAKAAEDAAEGDASEPAVESAPEPAAVEADTPEAGDDDAAASTTESTATDEATKEEKS
jgi:small subunit ribosomal protein S6